MQSSTTKKTFSKHLNDIHTKIYPHHWCWSSFFIVISNIEASYLVLSCTKKQFSYKNSIKMSTRQQSGGPPRGAVQSPMATRPDGANFDPKQQQKYDTQASATGVSLCQVVALTMVYRRLSVVAGSVPFLCVAIPIFIKILLLSVNSFTQDYGLATLILTTFLVLLWYQIIRVTAPNPEKEKEAYQKSHLRVPFVMFGFSYWFIRAVLWIGNKGQFDDRRAAQSGSLQFVPTFAWSVGARPACIFGVLGLAVITRYIGPFSVGTCS